MLNTPAACRANVVSPVTDFVSDAMPKTVAGVAGAPASLSRSPKPRRYTLPFLVTMLMAAPGTSCLAKKACAKSSKAGTHGKSSVTQGIMTGQQGRLTHVAREVARYPSAQRRDYY